MECVFCGGNAVIATKNKSARYRNEVVNLSREVFRCDACEEEFVTPAQARVYVRNVRNEIRKRYGLLSPQRIAEIRGKLGLTQAELEELLCLGSKVVVRWENGKVIQNGANDAMLRLLEKDPAMLDRLRQIQELRAKEQREYEASQSDQQISR